MANDDAKLKFLPRHLQRSQPAMPHKSKRRVTVEDDNAGDEESDRRSVFDRLGPGASTQRNEKGKSGYEFQDHSAHSGKDRGKRDTEGSPSSLKLKFKGGKDRETKVRSQVVVRGKAGDSNEDSADESDGWSMDKLEEKKDVSELEQRRLEIERELLALEAGEEVATDAKKSDTSDSDSSPERVHKKKKEKASKKKDKKKHKKIIPEKELSVEKSKEGKRKHDSDDEDEAPHKKRKKKSKDKKHVESSPVPLVSESVAKQKKSGLIKSGKGTVDLYDPSSPTSVARVETPVDKHSFSGSPKLKGKAKKKKKKIKLQGEAIGKSKKLLSPPMKFSKTKRGSASIGSSSRRSWSANRDVTKRASRSKSSTSSSESSSSRSPVRRKKSIDSSRERGMKKAVKPVEKKKRLRSQRSSSSSSSSTSSSTSSSSSQGPKRGRRHVASPERSLSQAHKQRSPAAAVTRKDGKGNKRTKRENSEVWSKSRDRGGNEVRQDRQSLDRGREKQRGRKANMDSRNRLNLSQPGHVAEEGRQDSKDGRKDNRELKGFKADVGRKDIRTAVKGPDVRKDRMKERGEPNLIKDREKRTGSLDRDREDRSRRGAQQNQQGDRNNRFNQRAAEDNDKRHFEEPNRRFGGTESSRVGQFGMDRPRTGPERGSGRGNETQAQGRLGDQTQGRRDWDERGRRDGPDERGRRDISDERGRRDGPDERGRRDGPDERGRRDGPAEDFRDDWESNRNNRGPAFGAGAYRDEGGREFGGGRDERRGGGREDRGSTHGSNDGNKPSLLPLSEGRDRAPQRAQGFRDDYIGKDSVPEKRDWKQREGSGDTSKQSARDRERSSKDEGADGRQSRSAGKPSADSSKDKSSLDKDKSKSEKSGSKHVMAPKMVKAESPVTRDELSLASVFSQTDTVVSRKKPSNSFGGKKSSKKEDPKSSEKPKVGVAGRSGLRIRDKKAPPPKVSDSSSNNRGKDEKSGKKEDLGKDKPSSSPLPRNAQKSSDPHHIPPKSGRKSKSPERVRGSGRSPISSNRPLDSARSPAKISTSPAPSAGRDRDREHSSRSPSDSRDRRKAADNRRGEKSKPNERSRTKRARSRSHSGSDSDSKHSNHSNTNERRRRKSSDSESLPAKLDGGDIAAAMLGDGLDDGLQDVFSDWSDNDSADSILYSGNVKVEDLDNNNDFDNTSRNRPSPSNVTRYDFRDMRPEPSSRNNPDMFSENRPVSNTLNFKIVVDTPKEKPAKEKKEGNEDKGYEEISSDENDLDEEGERLTKRTIVSILDIDMASLMPATKPTASNAPVFQRFKPASLFAEMGLSRQYAGDKLYQEVQETCQKQLEDLALLEKTSGNEDAQSDNCSSQPTSASKEKSGDGTKAGSEGLTIKLEELTVNVKPTTLKADEISPQDKPSPTPSQKSSLKKPLRAPSQPADARPVFKLYSDTSAYHKHAKAKSLERSRLLANFGMFRRALTARKDLEMRRQLCRIDPKYDQSAVYPSGVLDVDNFRLSLQLLKQKKTCGLGLAAVQPSACVS